MAIRKKQAKKKNTKHIVIAIKYQNLRRRFESWLIGSIIYCYFFINKNRLVINRYF